MNENFRNGFEKVANLLDGSRGKATVAGAVGGPIAGLFSGDGKEIRTAAGATAGFGLGTLATSKIIGGATVLKGPKALALALPILGGGLGAYLAHGKDKK